MLQWLTATLGAAVLFVVCLQTFKADAAVRELSSSDAAVQLEAARTLANLPAAVVEKTAGALPALVKALNSGDAAVQHQVARTLAGLPAATVVRTAGALAALVSAL